MVRWKPLKDITPYELALCVGVMISSTRSYMSSEKVQKELELLPPEARRHFE
jgi:hypothetical protein